MVTELIQDLPVNVLMVLLSTSVAGAKIGANVCDKVGASNTGRGVIIKYRPKHWSMIIPPLILRSPPCT